MPNIENLKKQAKLILRWHRERHYPVAAQIRADLPRFRHLSDPEVLAASFKLSDAQEMVARQHGFETWQALKTGVATMPETAERTTTKAVLTCAYPQLFVADIKASGDFYTEKLGFKITILYGEPPFYAHVTRDGATLILRHVDEPAFDAARRSMAGDRSRPTTRNPLRANPTEYVPVPQPTSSTWSPGFPSADIVLSTASSRSRWRGLWRRSSQVRLWMFQNSASPHQVRFRSVIAPFSRSCGRPEGRPGEGC